MSIIINGDTGVSGVDGSAATPSYQGTDTNAGIFYPAADTVAFGTNGSERMRITSTGNVGIGTTTPQAQEDIVFNNTASSKPIIRLGATSASTTTAATDGGFINYQNNNRLDISRGWHWTNGANYYSHATTGSCITLDESANILFLNGTGLTAGGNSNLSERLRIDSSGNVGIGTSSPNKLSITKALTINGSTGFSGVEISAADAIVCDLIASSSSANVGTRTAIPLTLATNGSERMRIDSSGNVGIGTTSPTSILDVRTSNPTRGIITSIVNTATSSQTGAQIRLTQSGIEDWVIGQPAAANAFAIWSGRSAGADGTERMRIDSSGNVMVGTTTSNGKLSTETTSATQRTIHAATNGGSATTDGVYYGYANQARGTGFNFMAFQNTSAVDFKVLGNGNVQNTNNSYGAISDVKLKENIVDATPKLDDLMKVKVRHYNFIDDELKTKQIGVVAQEVEQVFSGIVENIPDRDEEGNTLDSVTKSVKYSVFVPMLIKAIQEQQTIINDLKARIETLEGN